MRLDDICYKLFETKIIQILRLWTDDKIFFINKIVYNKFCVEEVRFIKSH